MLRFAVVSFLEPVALDSEYAAGALPLHVALLSSASTDADLGQVAEAVEQAVAAFPGFAARGGDDDEHDDGTEVTLLDEAGEIVDAHRALIAELRDLGVRVDDPGRVGRGFRPAVSITAEERIERGERVELRAVAILDCAPEGDGSRRRVVVQMPLL